MYTPEFDPQPPAPKPQGVSAEQMILNQLMACVQSDQWREYMVTVKFVAREIPKGREMRDFAVSVVCEKRVKVKEREKPKGGDCEFGT